MMELQRHKNAVEAGVTFGFAAGLVLALAEIIGAGIMGIGNEQPLKWAASIILGVGALYENIPGFALFVFAFTTHAILTVVHGTVFCMITRQLGWSRGMGVGMLSLVGLVFGVWTWVFNFQILGQTAFPWFLTASQWPQLIAHAVFFGLPLGFFFALSERYEMRAHKSRSVPSDKTSTVSP